MQKILLVMGLLLGGSSLGAFCLGLIATWSATFFGEVPRWPIELMLMGLLGVFLGGSAFAVATALAGWRRNKSDNKNGGQHGRQT